MEKTYLKDRQFRFWYYQASHGEAIIRSPKNEFSDKNIDILFCDVKYIEIPTMLSELQLDSANKEDIVYLSKKIRGTVQAKDITVLVSGEQRFYVIASCIKVMENTLNMMELPVHTFMRGRP